MSQYFSHINIKVTSPDIWTRFEDADDGWFDLANCKCLSAYIDEFSLIEDELTGLVYSLAKTLKNDGIVIASTQNINVDPYTFYVYSFGCGVQWGCYEEAGQPCDLLGHEFDVAGWINYGRFRLSDEERENLKRFKIFNYLENGRHVYAELPSELKLADRIPLMKTDINGRGSIIEHIALLDEVTFACTDSKPNVEVIHNGSIIGLLPPDTAEALYPLIAFGQLDYTAKIIKTVPLYKRNKHASNSIVEIHIEANLLSENNTRDDPDVWQKFLPISQNPLHAKTGSASDVTGEPLFGAETEKWQQYMMGIL